MPDAGNTIVENTDMVTVLSTFLLWRQTNKTMGKPQINQQIK